MVARDETPRVPRGWATAEPLRIGFGGYRVEEAVPEHRRALELFLERGGQVLDTAANYTSGGSERLIGAVLAGRETAGLTLITKAGYLEPMAESRAKDGLGLDFPERVDTGYGFFHCIHPRFLEAALARSLRRLKRERVDVFLLHNPEYLLTHGQQGGAIAKGAEPDALRVEFRRRVGEAFSWLEGRVQAGDIGGYGVSSNKLGQPPTNPQAVTVVELMDIARSVASEPAFSTIQCPLNLLERDPCLPLCGEGRSSIQRARELGVAVLTNRPLNAWRGMQIQLREGRARDTRTELFLAALRRGVEGAGYTRDDELDGWTLSHTALDLVRSHPDVTCVLTGMRRPAYVRMAMEVLAQPPVTDAEAIIRGLY